MSELVCPSHKIKMEQPECRRCEGEGLLEDDDDLMSFRPTFVSCYSCAGSGVAPYHVCELCEQEALDDEMDYKFEQEPA